MTFEQTVELYASILRQLLPAGGYDTSPKSVVAKMYTLMQEYLHKLMLMQNVF